ncbi:MAG: hypothetical protein J2P49_06280 [Methylocapsa sp.]|nr:hypothetical protein [Methylocapsa sp.]
MSAPDPRAMLDRGHAMLSIRRQCAVLHIARSSVYRPKAPADDNDLVLMCRIDELDLKYPRRMAAVLPENGARQS